MSMAATTKRWTLEELHRLPDDGNKYEVVHGELFVTPAPSMGHETIIARLNRILVPYVEAQGLGLVFHARSVVRQDESEVEPDLQVRQPPPSRGNEWETWVVPILAVEVLSDSTRRRDRGPKRDFYINDVRIPEYWIVDPERRTLTSLHAGLPESTLAETMTWHPAGASEPLTFALADIFA